MKRGLLLLVVVVILAGVGVTLVGFGGPVGSEEAAKLAKWLDAQSFSTWSTFRDTDRTPPRPDSPDGLTLGSPNVFAAIGCNPDDLSEVEVLWGDKRTARALAKPITVSARVDTASTPLAGFPKQTLRRVRHTSISVFEAERGDLTVRAVDFAPMGEQDNYLVRWFLVENRGRRPRRVTLSLHVAAAGDWVKKGRHAYQIGDRLALVSDADLRAGDEALQLPMGRLGSGQRAAAAVLFVAVTEAKDLPPHQARAEKASADLLSLLEATETDWTAWCRRAPLESGDQHTDDLLDSLLCLVRSHIGPEAIHTGSVRYQHDRAWVRDDYWVQRALLELGYTDEARRGLDFFHRAWSVSGIASAYRIPDGKPMSYGYTRVELPHYLVLMVRDAEQLGGADGTRYWDMVRGCLDGAAVEADGLQPMNGDETWVLAAPVRELDDLLDNSWLLIASAEYGSKLALRMNDRDRAARYGSIAYRARMATREFLPYQGEPDWYAAGLGGEDGAHSCDFSLCPEVYARAAILGVLPAADPFVSSGLVASWEHLSFSRGIRTHTRSATISGGTPGYVLYAAADSPGAESLFVPDLLERMTRFASATGCVWEFHDAYDPAWAGEKRRLWDSAVLLMGMTHALFDTYREGKEFHLVRRPAPLTVALPAKDEPGYDAQDLLANASGPLILQDQSPEHAARVARELLRQCNREVGIAPYTGELPADLSAIIISPSDPPDTWLPAPGGYLIRAWSGPPQLWVVSLGDVFRDTDGLVRDLLTALAPQRDKPLPFPDANFDLAARYGEEPAGVADVTVSSGARSVDRSLNLAGGRASLRLAAADAEVQAGSSSHHGALDLTVTAARPQGADIVITLPAGWWLIYARDMTGAWDRAVDRVTDTHLPDGRLRLHYTLPPNTQPFHTTFTLTKLRVD
jgi:hypothetical protein